MNRFIILITIIVSSVFSTLCFADDYVQGYFRKDGTYVSPHFRSESNSYVTDNYSFKGNYNSYTGSYGTNHYRKSISSPYYDYGTSSNRRSFNYDNE